MESDLADAAAYAVSAASPACVPPPLTMQAIIDAVQPNPWIRRFVEAHALRRALAREAVLIQVSTGESRGRFLCETCFDAMTDRVIHGETGLEEAQCEACGRHDTRPKEFPYPADPVSEERR